MRAVLPANESERLQALHSYEILDTPPEEAFDRLTRAASRIFGVPISFIGLLDENRQFLKSAYGSNLRETEFVGFCEHTIAADALLVSPDTRADERFKDFPHVFSEPGIRYFAATPLKSPDGFPLGILCVLDTLPHPAPAQWQLDVLQDLGAAAVEQLEAVKTRHSLRKYEAELARREAELGRQKQCIEETERRATLALEAGGLGYFDWDAVAKTAVWSEMHNRMLDFPADCQPSLELWLSKIHPEDRERMSLEFEAAAKESEFFTFSYRLLLADGEVRWVRARGSCRRDSEGRLIGITSVTGDVTGTELAARELQRSEALFRGLSDSSPLGIYRAGLDGCVSYVNPKTAEMWKMAEGEMLGIGWTSRVHPDDVGSLLTNWATANAEGREYGQEFRLLFPDGSVSWVSGKSAVILDQDGRPTGTVGTVDDITDIKRFQRELESAKDAAEAASRAKDLFLANVSHELRTPLNGILGMTDVLLETELTAEQRDLADTVRFSGQTLLSVVNDLLDLCRIEAGKLRIESAPFDLRRTVARSAALLQCQAKSKGLELTVEYPSELGSDFIGDPDRIQQILVNYLSNAIKFTDYGEVRLEVRSEEIRDQKSHLLIAVHDSGSGISTKAQERLFHPFTQVDGSSARRHGGAGLGLAISRRLAHLMGGTVGVTSEPGKGSTFWLRLPLSPVKEKPEAQQLNHKTAAPARGGHLLLAEDNAVNQKVAVHLLRKLGWSADVVPDGGTAYDLIQRNEYSLVLMDCQMPVVDGYTATSMIRSYEASQPGKRTPIVALTAHAMNGDRERCLHAGMDDYLSKPLQLDNLRRVLERWAQPVAV